MRACVSWTSDADGHSDLVFSDAERSAAYAFRRWLRAGRGSCSDVPRGPEASLPMIVRADGTNNGAWFNHRDMWVQNEDTGGTAPFHVDHRQLRRRTTADRTGTHARRCPAETASETVQDLQLQPVGAAITMEQSLW